MLLKQHLAALFQKCSLKLNLLRKLSNTHYGAHQSTLLQLYNTLIRSTMDYGASIYLSASPPSLQCLHTIENTALRLALGAIRSTPVTSLHVAANQLPLDLHRQYQALLHFLRISSLPKHPTRASTTIGHLEPYSAKNFHHQIATFLSELDIQLPPTSHSCLAALPPWTGLPLKIVLAPETISRDSNPPIVQSEFASFLTNYSTALTFYTDGSAQNNLVGCAGF
ncbi:hypothetical protein PGB90_006480 [Kerria lacca]